MWALKFTPEYSNFCCESFLFVLKSLPSLLSLRALEDSFTSSSSGLFFVSHTTPMLAKEQPTAKEGLFWRVLRVGQSRKLTRGCRHSQQAEPVQKPLVAVFANISVDV